jgi:hypothetical protein
MSPLLFSVMLLTGSPCARDTHSDDQTTDRRHDVDLLVMGTQGHRGVERAVSGSVAEDERPACRGRIATRTGISLWLTVCCRRRTCSFPNQHIPEVDPVSDDLRETLRWVTEAVRDVYASRLQRLILFGSRARGDATAESDVDVLVVLEGQIRI